MRPSNQNRIESLRSRRAQIDAELARLEAKAKGEARKADTRRKILLGAVVMQEMISDPSLEKLVMDLVAKNLVRPRDRELFGLSASKTGDPQLGLGGSKE